MTPNFLARHRKVSKIFVTCDGRNTSFSTVEAVEVSKVSKAQALFQDNSVEHRIDFSGVILVGMVFSWRFVSWKQELLGLAMFGGLDCFSHVQILGMVW